jgi:hypothetical protein
MAATQQHRKQAEKEKQSDRNAVNQVRRHPPQPFAADCVGGKAGGDIKRRAGQAAGGESALDMIDLRDGRVEAAGRRRRDRAAKARPFAKAGWRAGRRHRIAR